MISDKIFTSSLRWSGVIALLLAVVSGAVGWFADNERGLVSALLGTAMSVAFLAITSASILLANRFAKSELYVGVFFGVVMGGWLVKFVLFLVLAWVLTEQEWVNNLILFLSVIAGVIASLVVDVIVLSKSRMPYASDVKLPGEDGDAR
ncbi:hypothetical protein GCM10027416_23910 [Okibacterium endophyticum]